MRDWSGVPLWPVPMTVLAVLWLAAAVGSVAGREPGMPVVPQSAAGASAGDESGAARAPTTQPLDSASATAAPATDRSRLTEPRTGAMGIAPGLSMTALSAVGAARE